MKLNIFVFISILIGFIFVTKVVNEQSNEIKLNLLKTEVNKMAKNKLSDYQEYLKSRDTLVPYNFTTEVSRINDRTLKIPFKVKEVYGPVNPDFALLDFNKDGFDDLFFEYYGLSGTGEKNLIDIYFFEPTKNKFTDTCFTLWNPSYFFDKNIITTYYYGNGGGSATKYLLSDGKFLPIENVEIAIEFSKDFKATFWYSQNPFSDTLKFVDTMMRLPKEYAYRRIIK